MALCKERYFSDQKRFECTVNEFLRDWKDKLLYLKDWHFMRDHPNYELFQVPDMFIDDWVHQNWNFVNVNKPDDYRFIYFGPSSSFTPMHSDVLASHSWSISVKGCKVWYFFPNHVKKHLKNRYIL